MATTSPDNIYSADINTPQNLPAITGAMASSVQEALNKRGNAYAGTSSQRNSATGTVNEGTLWKDTDGGKELWVKDGGAWLKIWPQAAYSMQAINAYVTGGNSATRDVYTGLGSMTIAHATNLGPFTLNTPTGNSPNGTHIVANTSGLFHIEGWIRLVEMNITGAYMQVVNNGTVIKNIMVQGLEAFAKSKPTFSIQHSTVLSPGDKLGVRFTYTGDGSPSTSEVRSGEWSGFSATYFGSSA